MSTIQLIVAKALGNAAVSAVLMGVVAWNTNNKCRDGLYPSLAKHCPEDATVLIFIAGICVAVFVGSVLSAKSRDRRKITNAGDGAGPNR